MRYRDLVTESQRDLSPKFKQWFGNSKVVDSSGKPMVVYHGTDHYDDFDSFRTFSHFGGKDAANDIFDIKGVDLANNTRIIPVFLKIENPILLLDEWGPYEGLLIQQLAQKLIKQGHKDIGEKIIDEIEGPLNNDGQAVEDGRVYYPYYDANYIISLVRQAGYDGVCYKNAIEGDSEELSWVAFENKQIRSAFKRENWV